MESHNVRLSSAEIGGLWSTFIQETMSVCLLKYFLHHLKDDTIKPLLEKALHKSETYIQQISEIFTKENIPIPNGLSVKEDINLNAPPLFYDPFALSFVYSMARMNMINYAFVTVNIARTDILDFFTNAVSHSTTLYKESTTLMLSKGIYDRPPMIPYPKKVEYIKKNSYVTDVIGKKRPLNTVELTQLFFNIERNYFAIILCIGLLQVVKDKEIKKYLKEGQDISEKQINLFNDLLKKEELLGLVTVNIEVTDSTVSPFSDKLIMLLFNSLNSIDITLIGYALSLSLRVDLTTYYSKFIPEILLYSKKGFDIMVEREWLEEPPHAVNRDELKNGK
ncbi:DUF3231 family protein [Schinkia sp. CFF1]